MRGRSRRLLLNAPATACRLAGPVAGATQNAREDVRFPVDHVGIAIAAMRDQSDVFGNRSMGRTRPLTVDYLVKVVGRSNISGLQYSPPRGCGPLCFLCLG